MQAIRHDHDTVLCECDLDALKAHVEHLETRHEIRVFKHPAVCLTMIRAEDSLEKQGFFLGEALATECEVEVNGAIGYGLCLGEEPIRAYCIAVCDALLHGERAGGPDDELIAFLEHHRATLEQREKEEFNHILRSQVDFKLMEQD